MGYGDFRALNALLDKKDEFILKLKDVLTGSNVSNAINALKATGIGVNIYGGNNRYKNLYKKSIDLMKEHTKNQQEIDELDEYIKQVSILSELFEVFYSQKEFHDTKTIAEDKKLLSFLICLESTIRVFNDIVHENGKNSVKYPFRINFSKDFGEYKADVSEMSSEQQVGIFENMTQESGKIISFLEYFECKNTNHIGINEKIDIDSIKKSFGHFLLIDKRNRLFSIFQSWRFNPYIITKQDNSVTIVPSNEDNYISETIAENRSETKRTKLMLKFNNKNYDKSMIDYSTAILPPQKYLDEFELTDAFTCGDYFLSSTLNEKCGEVPLKEWIRAYAIIRKVSNEFLHKEDFPRCFSLDTWCVVKTEDEWKNEFTKSGISETNAGIIIQTFIFDEHAIDLYDNPFIKLGENLIIIPSISSITQGSRAMTSLFPRKGIDISFTGDNFENIIKSEFVHNGIDAKGIYHKVKNDISQSEEYQCDLAFAMDKDLFICELKSFLQPFKPLDFYEFEHKKEEAVTQLARIANFYSNNLSFIRQALNLEVNWTPRRIYKLLVVSCMIGKSETIDDTYIIDGSSLSVFLNRKIPRMILYGNGRDTSYTNLNNSNYDWMLTGKMTTHKFISFIERPVPIQFERSRLKKSLQTIPIGDYEVIRLYIDKIVDTFNSFPNESYKQNVQRLKEYAKSIK